ncbi:MAG TPA: hypothetical protein VI959_04940 [Alphaproteobacteria bacterium]|nr:hypothetical protein [Alphaproteobacteria bacterium]
MALTPQDCKKITEIFLVIFDKEDHLWLIQSPPAYEGFIADLYLFIETFSQDFEDIFQKKTSFIKEIKKRLGDQYGIDLVTKTPFETPPVYEKFKKEGLKLH